MPLAPGWELWRLVMVRAAGFPVDGVVALAAPGAAAAADRLPEPPDLAEYRRAFAAGMAPVAGAVERIAGDPRFHEAVLWQNRAAARSGIWVESRRRPEVRNLRWRMREALVAKYWQRYCAKNDTIGYFGPVGWGRVDPGAGTTTARPGPGLVAQREVFFETWCVRELARALERDARLAPWLAPVLSPELSLDGAVLHRPRQAPARLGRAEAALLARCDGRRPAAEIAAELAAAPGSGFGRPADVLAQLDNLRRRGIVRWGLDLPLDLRADRLLRERLSAVPDPGVREPALGGLAALERSRRALAAASGREEVDAGLQDLEEAFTRETGAPPTRSPGEAYAGRTLVTLECRRDLEVTVGRDVLSALAGPLSLLLQSARWVTWEARLAYERALRGLHRELAGSGAVELAELWYVSQSLLFGAGPRPVDAVLDGFRQRWHELLRLDAGGERVDVTPEELAPAVAEAFAAPRPGWPAARQHSPDLLVAAASLEDLRAGRFELVLGELHVAWNGIDSANAVALHPRPDELLAAVDGDIAGPRVLPLLPDDWPRRSMRTRPVLARSRDFVLGFTAAAPEVGPARPLPVTALVVEEDGAGALRARSRDGRIDLDLLDLYGPFLSMLVVDCFRSLAEGERRPRARIGRLTVVRRTWGFRPDVLGFATCRGDEAERFRLARAWACREGLPRFVFVHVPGELKPFFADLESPVSINVLSSFLRAAVGRGQGRAPASVTEMLPGPGECWLPDAAGRRYASELRLVAVDTA